MRPYKTILFFLLLLAGCLSAQTGTIEISGKVSDQYYPSRRIFCFKARISFNDSLFIETECDSNGYYHFVVSETLMRNYKTSVSVCQDQKLLTRLFPQPDCPYLYVGPARYHFRSKGNSIVYTPEIKHYVV